jgi:hypothetical protein
MTSIAVVVVAGVRLMEMDGRWEQNKKLARSLSGWGPRARDHSLLPGIPGRLLAAWLLHIPLALDAPTFIS